MATRSLIIRCIRLRDQAGATLVEFAIAGLLFFTVLFGIIEFGLLMYNQQVITNAGREGARHGIVARPEGYKVTKASIEQEAKRFENFIVSFGDKNFTVDSTFTSGQSYCDQFQDRLTVDVTYDYSFLFLPFSEKTLGTTAIMVCE